MPSTTRMYVLVDTGVLLRFFDRWKLSIVHNQVRGKQVHDARLIAFMRAHGFDHILTLDPGDFQRYPGITILTPAMLAATR